MTTDTDLFDLEQRLRENLSAWADEAPVARDRLDEIESHAPVRDGRRSLGVVPAAAAIALVVLVAGLLAWPSDDDREPPTIAGPERTSRTYVGATPGVRGLTFGGGFLWATSAPDGEVFQIDPASGDVVRTIDVGAAVEGIAHTDGTLWLTAYEPARLLEVDVDSGDVVTTIPMADPHGPTIAFDRVWVGDGDSVVRVEPASGAVDRFFLDGRSAGFVRGVGDELWVTNPREGLITAIDPDDGATVGQVRLGGEPRTIVEADGSLWVAVVGDDTVVRVDPDARRRLAVVEVGAFPHSLAAVGDEVWVTEMISATVSRIDTATDELITTHPVGIVPGGMAVVGDDVWVAKHREGALLRLPVGGPPLESARPTVARVVDTSAGAVYVRCSGSEDAGSPTVVLEPDVWGNAGDWAQVEALLAPTTSVCVTDRTALQTIRPAPPFDIPSLAERVRAGLEAVGVSGPIVVVGKGYGGMVVRQLAATWDDVVGVVLVDTNTNVDADVLPDEEEMFEGIRSSFDEVDALPIGMPVRVVISGTIPGGPLDPRAARDPEVRQRWVGAHVALAERFGTELVVVDGDEWVPTYRPERLVDLILDLA